MDSKRIQLAARKALMAADMHYYSWEPQQQERFRATMDEAAQARVDAILLNELLGIACTPKNARKHWRDLPLARLDVLNWAKLLTTGIGEDMFYLNESFEEGKSLLDFDTLRDYDFNDHLFQERANKEQFSHYQARDYYALRFARWARLLIDGQFHYATLYSLAAYLGDRIDEVSHDLIQALIPHQYVDGKEHGKPVKGGFRWDMQIDAKGLEKQLEELRLRWHQYLQEHWVELSKDFAGRAPAVFMMDYRQDGELHRDFIFNNEAALKQVHWKRFLKECERLRADHTTVTDREKQELVKAETWLRETHEDILRNFDPDVVRFRKRMKVVIAPGAFDGLVGEDDDEGGKE